MLRPVPRDEQLLEPIPNVEERAIDQAYRILQVVYVFLPLIAGVDKYFHRLTNWDQYVSPIVMRVLGPHGTQYFMKVDGAIEIIVGIGVAIWPRIFAYIASLWLLGIVINLLTTGFYFDIALRDFALCLGAFALGRLAGAAADHDHFKTGKSKEQLV